MRKFLCATGFLLATLFCTAQTGNVGIGTTTPAARLHVTDSSVLFSTSGGVPSQSAIGNPPATGAGRRMMWWPNKAAFRTGYVSGNQWDRDNIGSYSFATGYNTQALGFVSSASGYLSMASGDYSTAIGYNSIASGEYSFASGYASTASGIISTVLGYGLYARSFGEVAIGNYNLDYTATGTNSINAADRIFSIGNGGSAANRSNALTVFKNGNIGLGTDAPFGRLANTNKNTQGSDGQGGNLLGFNWRADQPGYAVEFYNGYTTSTPNGLAVKVLSTAGTALDISQGEQETLGSSLLIVKSSGNVGIGTSSPATRLEVAETIRANEVGSAENGNANMLAVAYGVVYSNTTNTIVSSSNNCTVSHIGGTGIYNITFTGSNLLGTATGNLPIVISPYGAAPGFVSWTGGTGTITVYTFGSNGVATDRGFSFAVYKP